MSLANIFFIKILHECGRVWLAGQGVLLFIKALKKNPSAKDAIWSLVFVILYQTLCRALSTWKSSHAKVQIEWFMLHQCCRSFGNAHTDCTWWSLCGACAVSQLVFKQFCGKVSVVLFRKLLQPSLASAQYSPIYAHTYYFMMLTVIYTEMQYIVWHFILQRLRRTACIVTYM